MSTTGRAGQVAEVASAMWKDPGTAPGAQAHNGVMRVEAMAGECRRLQASTGGVA